MDFSLDKVTSVNTAGSMKKVELGELPKEIGLADNQKDFSSFLKDAVNELSKTQQDAEKATTALITGNVEDFHTPIIAMEKASLTLGLAVTVRNKVLNAYQEIMRMQI